MSKRPHIFLDLDNTIISTEPTETFPFLEEGIEEHVTKFNLHNIDDYYIMAERPGVQHFLDFLFRNYDVSVWTAASKSYAAFIIEHVILIKPERMLQYVFYSYHCKLSKKKYNTPKQLKMWEGHKIVGLDLDRTVIIDDLDKVYEAQPEQCINIVPFEFIARDSKNDRELEKVKQELIKRFDGK